MHALPQNSVPATASTAGSELAALINPLSFRMHLHQRSPRTAARVRAHGGVVFEVDGLGEIQAALHQAIDGGARRLVIAGGDGTLQATVSWLATNLAETHFPELIVLSAGRTNYVAGDIGTRRHFVESIDAILQKPPRELHPVDRRSLRCLHPSIGQQQGFFLAGAMVDEVIREVHQWQLRQPGRFVRQYAASTTGVLSLAARRAVGKVRFSLPVLRIRTDALGSLDARCRFLLATSLPLSGHWINPYDPRGQGPLRVTAIADGAKGWIRRLPRLFRGRFSEGMNPESGYLSGNCGSILIENLEKFTLDGQEFTVDPSVPLKLEPGPCFRFLRP